VKFILITLFFWPTLLWADLFVPASFSANFEESIISLASGKEKKSFGKIDYKYPGNVRFEILSPNPSTFVSNSEKSWYYVPPFLEGEQGQLTIQKSSKLPLTKFLDSIRSGIENSKFFSTKYLSNQITLSFVPSAQKELGLKEVTLFSSKDAKDIKSLGELQGLILLYADGRKVNLKFLEFKPDITFNPKHFEFNAPQKTKIIED
jgi:outer membrane lipoprotein-sorting protein